MKAIAAVRKVMPGNLSQAEAARLSLPNTSIVVAEDGTATFALPPGEFFVHFVRRSIADCFRG